MKRIISIILVLTLLMSSSTFVFADEKVYEDPNEIVCYLQGIAITRSDVNESGMIVNQAKLDASLLIKNGINSKKSLNNNNVIVMSVPDPGGDDIITIINGNSCIVERDVYAPSFHQESYDMYYSRDRGAQFATNISPNIWVSGGASFILSWIPGKISKLISIGIIVDGLNRGYVTNKIRSYTDLGNPVNVEIIKTNLSSASYYAVRPWNGTQVNIAPTNSSEVVGTVTIFN